MSYDVQNHDNLPWVLILNGSPDFVPEYYATAAEAEQALHEIIGDGDNVTSVDIFKRYIRVAPTPEQSQRAAEGERVINLTNTLLM